MLFKLASDGKNTFMELDGKTMGANVEQVQFSHDAKGGKDGKGDVKLSLTFDLSGVFRREQNGANWGLAEEDGLFDERVRNLTERQKELHDEYNSLHEQRERIRKELLDEKPQPQ